MSAVTNALATGSTTNGTSYASGAFTPAAGDYLLVSVHASDTAVDGTISDSQGLSWSKIGSVVSNTNNRVITFISTTTAAASSMTVTWDCTGDAATGAIVSIVRISGSGGQVRQFATKSGLAAVAPNVTFALNCLTTSAVIFVQCNLTNPHGMTAPTGYVSRNGGGYGTPATGINACSKNSGETSNTVTAAGNSATDWTVFGIELYDTGISTQTLTPSLFTNSNTFFAPTVSAGKTLTPSLFTNSSAFFAAVVTASITLTPSLYADTDTFYSPTVSQSGGAQTLTPSLFVNGNTFYAPTVTRGAITLTPSLYADADVFYSATVTPGPVSLSPALYANSNTFYAHTVSAGPVTLTPSFYSNQNSFYEPAVSSSIVLTPGLYNNTNIFYSATVTLGTVTLTPDIFVDPDTFFSHTIIDFLAIPQGTIAAVYSQPSIASTYSQPVIAAAYTEYTIEASI